MKSIGLNCRNSILLIIFFPSALILCVSELASAVPWLPENVTVPAIFVFGDSIVDPGNNNELSTIAKSNFPPYGRDFAGGKPTGRFSNGKIPSDKLAEAFGLKELLPAYLDPDLKIPNLLTGVSFIRQTSKDFNVLSLSDQLDLYNESIAKIKLAVGEDKAKSIVSDSVYFLCIGSNDFTQTFFRPFSQHNNISTYTDFMADSAANFVRALYGFGARRIGLYGIPPVGCVPSQRTLRGGIGRECFDEANDAAVLFNSKFSSLAGSLNSQLSGSKILYLDIYNMFLPLIQNATQFGFEVSTKGCCGTGNLEVTFLCNKLEFLVTCKEDGKYVFWDSFHPTEKAYKYVIDRVLSDNMNKFF